jgi:AraC-like DNA-binding protein
LERDLHISKYYISHVMSQKLNIGFNDYVNSLRISSACRLLRKSDRSITEISELVGFNTLRTFNRAFFKQMGVTPSDYRLRRQPDSVPPSLPQ